MYRKNRFFIVKTPCQSKNSKLHPLQRHEFLRIRDGGSTFYGHGQMGEIKIIVTPIFHCTALVFIFCQLVIDQNALNLVTEPMLAWLLIHAQRISKSTNILSQTVRGFSFDWNLVYWHQIIKQYYYIVLDVKVQTELILSWTYRKHVKSIVHCGSSFILSSFE